MRSLPVEIYSVATVREIDRRAIEDEGIPGYTLMTRAGAAAIRAAREQFPDAKRWQVVCGAGNNAGDGYVVARLAAQDGIVVSVLALVDPESLTGDAATAYGDFAAEGGVVMAWEGVLDDEADLVVDALLGSGLERDVTGEFAKAVSAMNAHRAHVMALDIPTGVHGDTGQVMGTAVEADLTVTFVGLKAGLFSGEGAELSGVIAFDGLDVPEHCRPQAEAMSRRISDRVLRRCLKRRARSAHKGDFGHVLIIGGGEGMPGAVRLAGEAALRTGAGLVSVATHPAHASIIVGSRPELMSHGIADADSLAPLLEKATAVAFGPGLGTSEWARQLFAVVGGLELPCVWDADALNLLAEMPAQSDGRRAALIALQDKYGGVVVLKGANTLVTSKKKVPWLCTSGNPGMASPGMGDVLTGIIAALLAQGLGKEASAVVGVEAHARAGDRAARAGERGTIASDLIAELRNVINP
jgi:NAD(P)H-hydrate epimerase